MPIKIVIMLVMLGVTAHASEVDEKDVENCKKYAMKIPSGERPKPGDHSAWWVDKVTELVTPTIDTSISVPDNMNVCSAQGFLASLGCGSVFYTVELNQDETRTVVTQARSSRFDNIVKYTKELKVVSKTHLIFASTVTKMEICPKSGNCNSVDIPDYVQKTQGQLFAQAKISPERFELFRLCNANVAWTVISREKVNTDEERQIYMDMDASLREPGLTGLQYEVSLKIIPKEMETVK